jgi:hypothetical protein
VAGRSRTCGASRFRRPLYRAELRPRVSGRGWTRTSSLLFVRQALSAVELLALRELRDKDSNLDLRVQSAASWPLDDPGKKRSMSRRIGDATMLFMPLAHASTLDRCGFSAAARHRGGVLEPGARDRSTNSQAKAAVTCTASITASKRARTFLSQAGPRFSSRSSSSWASPCFVDVDSPSNDEGDPLGSPSLRAAMPHCY